MKKLFLLPITAMLLSCSSDINDVAGFQFEGAWYWLTEYNSDVEVSNLKEHVKTYSNPNQASYFFFFDKSRIDVSSLKNERFTKLDLFQTIVVNKPDTAFYMLPRHVDGELKNDAMWLIKNTLKSN